MRQGEAGEIQRSRAAATYAAKNRMHMRSTDGPRERVGPGRRKRETEEEHHMPTHSTHDRTTHSYGDRATQQKSGDSQHAPGSGAIRLSSAVIGSASTVQTDGMTGMHAHLCFHPCMRIAVRTQ